MISNGPSRTFTRDAVEAWLVRLSSCDWEKHIPESQLKLARSYYRDGYLSTLDLQENQAIVTKKSTGKKHTRWWNGAETTLLRSAHLWTMSS